MDSLDGLTDDIFNPPWGQIGRLFVLAATATCGKVFLKAFNRTKINNYETFYDSIANREKGFGLITVSNHKSTLDDPFLISTLIPYSVIWRDQWYDLVRWSLCAKEMCFKYYIISEYFLCGKVLPIDRKAGLEQPIMSQVASQVAKGGWLHLFPEGGICQTNHEMRKFKVGVGKVVCESYLEAQRQPIILPYYHFGMNNIIQVGSKIPSIGQNVEIDVGNPISIPQEVLEKCDCKEQYQTWKQITQIIENEMKGMQEYNKTKAQKRQQT